MHGSDLGIPLNVPEYLRQKTNMITMAGHGVKTFECSQGFDNIIDMFNGDETCDIIERYLPISEEKVKKWLWEDFFQEQPEKMAK